MMIHMHAVLMCYTIVELWSMSWLVLYTKRFFR